MEEELKESVAKVAFENFERLRRREGFRGLLDQERLDLAAGKEFMSDLLVVGSITAKMRADEMRRYIEKEHGKVKQG